MGVFTIRYDREGDWLEVLLDDTPAYLEEYARTSLRDARRKAVSLA